MRHLSPAFAAATFGAATTLCRCWKATRRDGVVLGFTDHDLDLVIDGVTYAARTGVEASEIESHFGFAVGGAEMAGALSADGLSEGDLARGLWDGATVEIFVVDWTNLAARHAIESGAIGEVRRHGASFAAELRGEAARLDEERGRVYSAACGAALGDPRCRVDLDQSQWRRSAAVDWSDGRALIRADALGDVEAGLFRSGSLVWTSGANRGFAQDVREHRLETEGAALAFWLAPPAPIEAGDAFTVTAGCDKRFATCRDRFANAANFRGFPHMPGNDHVLRVAREGEPDMDGASMFR
jgi:uncharacterized phage protein (TIGR02218 family)